VWHQKNWWLRSGGSNRPSANLIKELLAASKKSDVPPKCKPSPGQLAFFYDGKQKAFPSITSIPPLSPLWFFYVVFFSGSVDFFSGVGHKCEHMVLRC